MIQLEVVCKPEGGKASSGGGGESNSMARVLFIVVGVTLSLQLSLPLPLPYGGHTGSGASGHVAVASGTAAGTAQLRHEAFPTVYPVSIIQRTFIVHL